MGDKRMSTRTLPSGERVQHFPPDDIHPEGRVVLAPETSPLRDKLAAQYESDKAQLEELRQAHRDAIAAKRNAQADKGLPPEKSSL